MLLIQYFFDKYFFSRRPNPHRTGPPSRDGATVQRTEARPSRAGGRAFRAVFRPAPGRALGMALVLILAAALTGCREEPWDPEVAATVDGRPIPKSAVDQVLEWGFYPRLGQGGEVEGAVTLPQILDKLIDERLIVAAAEKAGLTVSEAEVDQAANGLVSAWFGAVPPPAELGELRQALRNQILLRTMTEKVMAERRNLSAGEWQKFWDAWPKDPPPRYLVRALLIPPVPEAADLPLSRWGSLEEQAHYLKKAGLTTIISDPMWLVGARQDPEVVKALEKALSLGRLTEPLRLPESWVVYDVLDVDRGQAPVEDFQAARVAFEALASEKAFLDWLKERRAKADIRINPIFAETVKN